MTDKGKTTLTVAEVCYVPACPCGKLIDPGQRVCPSCKPAWNAAMERAIFLAGGKASQIRDANTYRGRVNDMAEQSAAWIEMVADTIAKEKV